MRDLELRLALVCFGGSSLAVYMNGIVAELHRLARASASISQPRMLNGNRPLEESTLLYRELLQALEPERRLRVIIDVVAGASAGGLNGIFLSRALAHDMPMTPLRDMWLELGDMEELMRDYSLAKPWSKFYLYPLIWLTTRRNNAFLSLDEEQQAKIKQFVRSRWFHPPFSGPRMLDWMLSAAENMGRAHPTHSLMPTGHGLDLFVTVTNFFGNSRRLFLNDPPVVRERFHEKSLHFQYRRPVTGAMQTDFDDGNIAGLGFAARATSSFPGAFPPIRLNDLDAELSRRRLGWSGRDRFFAHNFADQIVTEEQRASLMAASFLDGGITNNKPFEDAINAMLTRPAHRAVDRRVLFVDPAPVPVGGVHDVREKVPGFFRTIMGALMEIPRNDPIFSDLRQVSDLNQEFSNMQNAVKAVEREVETLIDDIIRIEPEEHLSAAMMTGWRTRAQELAASQSGYGFSGYVMLRMELVFKRFGDLLHRALRAQGVRANQALISKAVHAWARATGLIDDDGQRPGGDAGDALLTKQMNFLCDLDVDYRLRRLRHVMRKINMMIAEDRDMPPGFKPEKFKRRLYLAIERGETLWSLERFPQVVDQTMLKDRARLMAEGPTIDDIDRAYQQLSGPMALRPQEEELDRFVAASLERVPAGADRDLVFRAYIGFDFIDPVLLPMTSQVTLKEMQPVKVDRISPLDCTFLKHQGGVDEGPLMGRSLNNFGAFFSRKARENDYLWGRLHAAERLVDLVIDAAGEKALPKGFDRNYFLARLTDAIIESEKATLTSIGPMIERLRPS